MLADSGASILIHAAGLEELARAATAGSTSIRHLLPVDPVPGGTLGTADYEQVVQSGMDAAPVSERVLLDDPCMTMYTSGTTGSPKGAVITHGNVTWNMFNQLAHVDILSSDVALGVAPWFHTAGLNQVTMPTLFKGGTVVVASRFDPGELLATVERLRITSFSAVPTMLLAIVDHPSWEASDVSSLRHVMYGGSPVVERVARAWVERGVPILQGYGMTEASPGVVMAVPDGAAERPVSAGVSHFFTDVEVLVGDDAQDGPNHAGELIVRGPNVFAGYWNRPKDTQSSFVDGWFRSGDAVRIDQDGWTYVVDRIKDVIISGGENIYPAEVEAALITLPGVQACSVVGVPDDRWGEVGMAFVVTQPGSGLAEADVVSHLNGLVARYKVPKHVRFVDDVPTTATGKVRRSLLRDQARALGRFSEQASADTR